MRVAPEGWIFIAIAWIIAGALALMGWWIPFALWLVVAVWVVAFFRDPIRKGLRGEQYIIAPADGLIVGIIEVDEPAFMGARAMRVSIFMNVFNVHVNRYPSSGVVGYRHYLPGRFGHAGTEKASAENEQSSIGLTTPRGKILIRQIAGLIARRIVTDHQVGTVVQQGERMGLIRFGSRVDIFVPRDAKVLVKDGEKTKAGFTVVAQWD
ncbi:MAG: phosphatidylserine decarboxylase family protein [Gemmatimonadota bacterium]